MQHPPGGDRFPDQLGRHGQLAGARAIPGTGQLGPDDTGSIAVQGGGDRRVGVDAAGKPLSQRPKQRLRPGPVVTGRGSVRG